MKTLIKGFPLMRFLVAYYSLDLKHSKLFEHLSGYAETLQLIDQ